MNIPERTVDGITRYVENHIPPGGFLTAVLENNLCESIGRADSENRDALVDIVRYLWNEIPAGCWGSPDRVEAWLNRQGGNTDQTIIRAVYITL